MNRPSPLAAVALAAGAITFSAPAFAQGTPPIVVTTPAGPPVVTPVGPPIAPPVNPLLIGTIGPGTLVGIGLATVIVGTVVRGDSSSDTQ